MATGAQIGIAGAKAATAAWADLNRALGKDTVRALRRIQRAQRRIVKATH